MENTHNWLREKWLRANKIGVTPDLSFSERLKVELSNQFALFGTPLVIIHAIRNFLGENLHTDNITSVGFVLYFFFGLWLNHIGKRKAARYWLIIFGSLYILMIHIVFGPENRLESLYILAAIGSLYFFKKKRAYLLAFFVTIMYLIGTIYSMFNPPLLEGYSREGTAIEFFIFAIFIISSLTTKILSENYNYQQLVLEKNDSLTKKNEQLKRFNYIVSHDLKEPIRSIVSFSNLLRRNQHDEASLKEYLGYIVRSGKVLNTLVEDIRIFQDLDERPIQYQKVELSEIIKETIEGLSEMIQEERALVNVEKLPAIRTSKSMFLLVFKNLIENGIKYNDSDVPEISLYSTQDDQNLHIYVQDNGIGIEEKFFEIIFVMFKRLNADREKGSGLGLNIARTIVERFEGTLRIHKSRVDEGSTFVISLPIEILQ